MTYGPGQHETKVVPHVINSLLNGQTPALSSGLWEADWVYVDDIVDAFLSAVTQPGIEGSSIDLGSGTLTSIRDIVASLVRLTKSSIQPQFGTLADRPHQQTRVADTADADRILGWKATTSLDEGLAATVDWHAAQQRSSNGGSVEYFKGTSSGISRVSAHR
jgi:nucleoside-diphosphate-sugar epimerase